MLRTGAEHTGTVTSPNLHYYRAFLRTPPRHQSTFQSDESAPLQTPREQKPLLSRGFLLVAEAGFEPATFWL